MVLSPASITNDYGTDPSGPGARAWPSNGLRPLPPPVLGATMGLLGSEPSRVHDGQSEA
jgi:hypothetical protein